MTVASKSVSQDRGVTNEADDQTPQLSGLRRQQIQQGNSTTAKLNDAARQLRHDENEEGRQRHSGSFKGNQRTRLTLVAVIASLIALINYECGDHLTTSAQC